METATVRGATLEYSVHGSGEPVLLVHGVMVADGFRPLVDEGELGSQYRLIAYHRRGYAGSDNASAPFTIADQAADALGLLAELDVAPAHVVGHSYGAAIALEAAATAPEAVATLTLLEAPQLSVPAAAQVVEAMGPIGERYASGDREGAVDDFLTAMGGPGYRAGLDSRLPGAFEQAVADADTFFEVEFPALPDWGFGADDAKRVDMPVLRVSGDRTIAWFSESDALLAKLLPKSERAAVAETGHLLQVEDPAPVSKPLADFLGRHPIGQRAASTTGGV
jgi:pimeloyl-ACP methyl ester carboxylesterase